MSVHLAGAALGVAITLAASGAAAQSAAAEQLGDPSHMRRRGLVHFGGSPRGGTFELARASERVTEPTQPLDGCELPCELSLDEGSWHVRFASGVSSDFSLHPGDVLVIEARPDNDLARWLGVATGVAGLALLAITFGVDQGACFEGTSCENIWVLPLMAVGGLAVFVGVYLAIDASGRVNVTQLAAGSP